MAEIGEQLVLPGAEAPLAIITDIFDPRRPEELLSGVFYTIELFIEHAATHGLDVTELRDPSVDAFDRLTDVYSQRLDTDTAFRDLHDAWIGDLNRSGFRKLFGDEAVRECSVDTVSTPDRLTPRRSLMYHGELPDVLANDQTREVLQSYLNIRYGKHGVLFSSTSIVALFPDVSVTITPYARTLIQGDKDVWHLETYTNHRRIDQDIPA